MGDRGITRVAASHYGLLQNHSYPMPVNPPRDFGDSIISVTFLFLQIKKSTAGLI